MANPEHLAILKQGVEVWNRWRKKKPEIVPDLSKADLRRIRLRRANLQRVNLYGASLEYGNLYRADLSNASLVETNLSQTYLGRTYFYRTDFDNAILNEARIILTTFGDVDLSVVKGLETVIHEGPSIVGVDTIYRSGGKIPKVFLQGVGTPDTFVTYAASLVGQSIQYYSCFISYCSQDEAFARRLHADLQQTSVRCWFAPEDMKIGDKIRPVIDQSIRIHDKLLIILSENSLNSVWVESEVEKAFEEERQRGQTVLFPVRLDEAVMDTGQPWAAEIRRTRHIGDFSRWKDHDSYQAAFERLLRDLKAEG